MGSDKSDASILSLASSSESWVIDLGASFHATSYHEIFQNYMKWDFGKVYLGDDEPCNIIGKSNVTINLSNESTLKLKDDGHVPKMKRNLMSIGQLADAEMKTTFDGDSCKITMSAMIMVHGKKKGALYMMSGSTASISVASFDVDAGTWHPDLGI